jgi:glycopeptide antibiotics resistance protein
MIQRTGIFLFGVYVLLLIYFLFFSEEYGRIAQVERVYRYNLVPFVEIRRFWQYREQLGKFAVLTNLFGNVLGFVPFGFILPIITGRMRSGVLVVMSGFGVSLTVEVIQLVTKVGCFDVDDLILNTLGVLIGYLMFFLCNYLRRRHNGKKI